MRNDPRSLVSELATAAHSFIASHPRALFSPRVIVVENTSMLPSSVSFYAEAKCRFRSLYRYSSRISSSRRGCKEVRWKQAIIFARKNKQRKQKRALMSSLAGCDAAATSKGSRMNSEAHLLYLRYTYSYITFRVCNERTLVG